jgi:hypothetical protein
MKSAVADFGPVRVGSPMPRFIPMTYPEPAGYSAVSVPPAAIYVRIFGNLFCRTRRVAVRVSG